MKNTLHTFNRLTKAVLVFASFLFAGLNSRSQTTPYPVSDSISIADVSAQMYADGTSFWNPLTGLPKYRVPKTGPACSIFSGSMWIGGLDGGGHLHMAAETYKQSGNDFWPGPIMDSINYSSHQDTLWNKIWKVNKSTIDSFKNHLCVGIPASIANWPGNGDVALGEAAKLAPYEDVDNNGTYDPSGGDYPIIRGDQALFMMYNDARDTAHGETGGLKLNVEVHLMAYQYNLPLDTPVYQTTFLHYDVFNRSNYEYHNVYLGYYCDMDLGNGSNDFIGCDSANNYWYTYNGTATDPDGLGETGYGGPTPPPPAQSVAYLCDTMKHFIYYNNDYSGQGNPRYPWEYYDYMRSIWADSSAMTYGGTGYHSSPDATNYMFTGNPATGTGWSEVSAGDGPGDRRGLSSAGPFTLEPGADKTMDLALVFSRANTGNQNTSVTTLGTAVQNVKSFYAEEGYFCDSPLAVDEVKTPQVTTLLYPNPFHTNATLSVGVNTELKNAVLEVHDVTGRTVYRQDNIHENNISISRGNLETGLYFYRLTQNGQILVNGKFIVE